MAGRVLACPWPHRHCVSPFLQENNPSVTEGLSVWMWISKMTVTSKMWLWISKLTLAALSKGCLQLEGMGQKHDLCCQKLIFFFFYYTHYIFGAAKQPACFAYKLLIYPTLVQRDRRNFLQEEEQLDYKRGREKMPHTPLQLLLRWYHPVLSARDNPPKWRWTRHESRLAGKYQKKTCTNAQVIQGWYLQKITDTANCLNSSPLEKALPFLCDPPSVQPSEHISLPLTCLPDKSPRRLFPSSHSATQTANSQFNHLPNVTMVSQVSYQSLFPRYNLKCFS